MIRLRLCLLYRFLLDVKSSEKAPQLDRVFDLGLPLYEKVSARLSR